MRKLAAFCEKIVFHPDPIKRTIITFIYCGVGIFFNFFVLQVFCMPVMYASFMCIAFYIALLAFPFIHNKVLKAVACFLLGTGVPICIYCADFLTSGDEGIFNYFFFLLAILLLGAGLLGFIPFYLLLHIRRYYNVVTVWGKRFMIAGIIMPCVALGIYISAFHSYLKLAKQVEHRSANMDQFVSHLPANYFTERTLGLSWKYHTSLEYVYDGWRPPMHDPFLLIGLWVSSLIGEYPGGEKSLWPFYFQDQVMYYHKKFPNRTIRESCPCSYSADGMSYFSKSGWEDRPKNKN